MEENSTGGSPQVDYTPGPPAQTTKGLSKGVLFAIIGGATLALLMIVTAVVVTVTVIAQQARLGVFQSAVDTCAVNTTVEVMDGGRTLLIDGEGEDYGSGDISYDETTCMLELLNANSAVLTKMGETRALDGRQNAEWDGISASWSYHPDNGLDILLELTN